MHILQIALQVAVTTVALARQAHIADVVNSHHLTWKAERQDRATLYPPGVKEDARHVHARTLPLVVKDVPEKLPEEFDAREQWSECKNVIGNIRDQSRCGSCWAVAAASVFSDRKCIASKGSSQTSFSADDTLSCCTGTCGTGCGGGWPGMAWVWYTSTGVVTGGNYTDKDGCLPYPFPPGGTGNYKAPACADACQTSYTVDTYLQDKHFAKYAYRVTAYDPAQIQAHLYADGPLEVTFAVYDDFYHYRSGVYKVSSGAKYGGMHAVRLIGWGVEKDVPYWLVVNSWDTTWGMNGYFKIARGVNECGIEEDVVAGIVDS